jgi:hypothetical protein
VGTYFSSSQGKRWGLPVLYTWLSNLLFFFVFFLSFTTGDSGQFQSSYGKFLRCDKDSLGFVPLIFMGLWMAVKSEWAQCSCLPDSVDCAESQEDWGQGG